ncbi:MAG: DUF4124 domain-containing protein [Gammaproteobacteria bacterium]
MNRYAPRSDRLWWNGSGVRSPALVLLAYSILMSQCVWAHKTGSGAHPQVPVHVYQWTGPRGVTHFSQTPPPKSSRTKNVKHFTIRLARVSRKKARAEYLASLAQARSMERGLRRLEREQAAASPPLATGPFIPPAGQTGAGARRYVRGGIGFYPNLGDYPPELAPPLAAQPAGPPPNLAPPSGGFGICGYEIACPPMGAIPHPLGPPPPPSPVPHFPPHP